MSWWFDEYGWGWLGVGRADEGGPGQVGRVAPDLATGAYPQDAADVEVLRAAGVTTVVNLCADVEYAPGVRALVERAYAAAGITEHRTASEDHGNLAAPLLEDGARLVARALDGGERVYLHCRAGWQRSATVAAATLVVRDGLDPVAALATVAQARPQARPLDHQISDLRNWWRNR